MLVSKWLSVLAQVLAALRPGVSPEEAAKLPLPKILPVRRGVEPRGMWIYVSDFPNVGFVTWS